MAMIALASASGSPGVTTTALGLALLWPRPILLVEADPTGGSGLLAGYFRGTRDDPGLIAQQREAREVVGQCDLAAADNTDADGGCAHGYR